MLYLFKMKRVKKWFNKNTPSLLIGVLLVSIISGLFLYKIDSLTGGYSGPESSYVNAASDNSKTFANPLFIAHKLSISAIKAIADIEPARQLSAFFSFVVIISFYAVAKQWQTRRIAFLATILMAGSSWMLSAGRSALPLVLYLSWVPILATLYWLVKSKRHTLILYFWALATSFAFYIPGMIWFVSILAFTQKKRMMTIIKQAPRQHIIIVWLLFVIFMLPFFMMVFTTPLAAMAAIGLPTGLNQFIGAPRELIYTVFDIFFYGREQSLFRLSHLPYLDIVSVFLFVIGLYKIRYSSSKKMLKVVSTIVGIWLIGISLGTISPVILLPVFYFIMGSGLSFLLVQWLVVFPLNPYARAAGIIIIYVIVGSIFAQHTTRYFVAWPQNPQTNAVFSEVDDRIE